MRKFDPIVVGARLIEARSALGLRQVDICNRIGVSTSAWNRFETGARLIKPEAAQAFAEAYGFDLNFIYTGSERGLDDEMRRALADQRRQNSA
ncbi:helix-turn-helix domain-containing protein [Albimonas donghaensis]|uniref:helix-turn-helix domain-containing protein n=1 Tax=Albimonas donghaensis TaxID=356660 RepID=UPI000B86A981